MDRVKYITLNDPLYDYVLAHRTAAQDPLLEELRRTTDQLGDDAGMQISHEQGSFLTMMVGLTGAKACLEVGTFTGYSSICIARGLPSDGTLMCLDVSREWTDIARQFWKKEGVDSKIDLRLGPALDALSRLPKSMLFDFVFVDADKREYPEYYEAILPHMRKNGLMVFDNMLWHGRVVQTPFDADTQGIDDLNKKLAQDGRVEAVLVPFGDGLQLVRVR